MKQIGYGYKPYDTWEKWKNGTFNSGPGSDYVGDAIFIADPNDTPPNLHLWQHVGWVLPGDATNGGGRIYPGKEGKNSVATYVKRETPVTPQTIPAIDEIKAVILSLSERVERLERHMNSSREMIGMPQGAAHAFDRMTFYDHAFIAAYMMERQNPAAGPDKIVIANAHAIARMLTTARHPVTVASREADQE